MARHHLFRIVISALAVVVLARGAVIASQPRGLSWQLPDAREVQLGGPLGDAYRLGVERLGQDPYQSVVFLRSDLSFEMSRAFTNFSGDISGRFIEISSLLSPPGQMRSEVLRDLLKGITSYQKADGHFGCEVAWNGPLESPDSPNPVKLPIFWGNGRLLVALLEAHRAFSQPELLDAARRIGDFYIATADRLMDPAREAEYRQTGSYAAGYVTDYFSGIEGLARLDQVTKDDRYLRQAERMAEFFVRFDKLPIDHSHANLITHHGLLGLYRSTGKAEYLNRPLARWQEAVDGGYIWPTGGVGERFHVSTQTDEGCSAADWLRVNLELWSLTGETRFLDMAERLLWNHYAMNRTANGGYGHHDFVGDAEGPLLMEPNFREAVWCCTFHGLLGMHTLKSYLVAGSERGIFINFPVDFSAPVSTGQDTWNVKVSCQDSDEGTLTCRVHIDPVKAGTRVPNVFIRRPGWAETAKVSDRRDEACEVQADDGYLRLPLGAGADGEINVTFSSAPRVEDRRLKQLSLVPTALTRQRGVVLAHGPRVLLANADASRPVVVAIIDKAGSLVLPRTEASTRRLITVANLEATEDEIRQAVKNGSYVELGPWEKVRHDARVAFVFDLIAVPADSKLAEVMK